jgi:hypothetical protein
MTATAFSGGHSTKTTNQDMDRVWMAGSAGRTGRAVDVDGQWIANGGRAIRGARAMSGPVGG